MNFPLEKFAYQPSGLSGWSLYEVTSSYISSPPGWDAGPLQGYPPPPPSPPLSIKFASTHLYTWVKRGTVRVNCLAQEHINTMSLARVRTQTIWYGDGTWAHWTWGYQTSIISTCTSTFITTSRHLQYQEETKLSGLWSLSTFSTLVSSSSTTCSCVMWQKLNVVLVQYWCKPSAWFCHPQDGDWLYACILSSF